MTDIKVTLTISKKHYDIAMEIEDLPETKEKLDIYGTPEQQKKTHDLYESFGIKVRAIYKKNKLSGKGIIAVNRARNIIQLRAKEGI